MDIEEIQILDYLEGRLSEEERLAFEKKIKESETLQSEVGDLDLILSTMDNMKHLHKVNTVDRWKKMSFKLSVLKFKHKFFKTVQFFTVLLLIPVTLFVLDKGNLFIEKNDYLTEVVEVQSAYGVVSKILLPDSSIVYLNSGSTLTYPRAFEGDVRKVSLSGEAYFEVKSTTENRFDVELTDDLYISAYGTEFNINAYEDQGWISAVLAEGNISVQHKDALKPTISNVLQKGQLALYDKEAQSIDISSTNLYVATAWKDGKIVFRRSKLSDIAYRLSKHFNVDIDLNEKELTQYEFSATFTTETLTEILDLLQKASPIKWHYVEPEKQRDESYTKRKVIISLKHT